MKKILTAIITVLMMLPVTSFAVLDATLDNEENKINVSGKSDSNNVSILLLNPGYTISDTADTTLSEAVNFYRPVEVNNGEYFYEIKMSSSAGKGAYTLYADRDKKVIYYASAAERLSMISEVKTAVEEETLSDYLSVNGVYLCDSEKFLNADGLANIAALATQRLSETEIVENSPESLEEINDALDFSVVVQLLNEDKIEDISEVGKVTDEENMTIKYSQKSLIPSAKQEDVVKRISGRNIATEEGFYKALQESIFIGVINESKSLSSEKKREFFDDYAETANLDITNYDSLDSTTKGSVVAQLAAAKKTTISDMQTKLNELTGGGSDGEGGISGTPSTDTTSPGTSSHISAGGTGGGTVAEKESPKEEQKISFSDMKNYAWAEDAVNVLSTEKIINGYSDGTFKPEGNITRGEFVAMIARAFLPKYTGDSRSFDDINISDWHYDFVMSAYENKIVNGMGEGKFLPNEKIRRCDMAVILNNLLLYKGMTLETATLNFGDTDSIPEYAMQAVSVLNGNKIINGDDNNNFRPDDFANRAEAAVMLHRFINLTKEEGIK